LAVSAPFIIFNEFIREVAMVLRDDSYGLTLNTLEVKEELR